MSRDDMRDKAIGAPEEAKRVWATVCKGREPEKDWQGLVIRLALGMIENEEVRRAVIDISRDLEAAQGFLANMCRLAERVRVTPLIILAEFDPAVSEFLVRHPHTVPILLREQDYAGHGDQALGLTPQLKQDPHLFLGKMKQVAPLLLERADVGREHTEAFLWYLHEPEVIDQLSHANSVREELGPVLAGFCRRRNLPGELAAKSCLTRDVLDNVLWQVAVAVVGQRERRLEETEVRCLESVEQALAEQLNREEGPEPPQTTVEFALAACCDQQLAQRLKEGLNREYQRLIW
jgi:hypothetical protein